MFSPSRFHGKASMPMIVLQGTSIIFAFFSHCVLITNVVWMIHISPTINFKYESGKVFHPKTHLHSQHHHNSRCDASLAAFDVLRERSPTNLHFIVTSTIPTGCRITRFTSTKRSFWISTVYPFGETTITFTRTNLMEYIAECLTN